MKTEITEQIEIGFDAIKEKTVGEVIELEKQLGANQDKDNILLGEKGAGSYESMNLPAPL